ncbi:M48 family metalloprotease [bacterium]|nr:M48 family metalloprotease [bacterium]
MSLSLLSTLTIDMWADRLISASWQGGLLLAFVWLVCHFCKNVSANTKCWMWRIAYLKFAILLMFGGFLKLPVLQSNPQPSVSISRPTNNHLIANELNPLTSHVGSTDRNKTGELAIANETNTPSPPMAAPATASPAQESPSQFGSNPSEVSAASAPSGAVVLVLVWFVGFGIGVAFVGRQFIVANRLSRHGVPIKEPSILSGYRVLCSRLKMSSRPRLAMTSKITTPILVGAIRPTILIPSSMVRSLSSAELQLIIAHELGHAKRRDLFWNWLLVIVRTLFFFHPLVWITQKRFALDQEIACDQLALKTTNDHHPSYNGNP